jgi:hypothetical protein
LRLFRRDELSVEGTVEKATSSSQQLTLSVSTTLMQDYRQAAPLQDAKELALAWTPEGELEVFAIGLDKNLYVLRRDPASPTGWRERRVEFPPTVTSVTSLATLDVANEHDRMFVLANGYWYEMERDEAGSDRPRFLTVFPGALRLGASDCGDDVALVAAPYVQGQKLFPCSGILTGGIGFLLLDSQGGLSAEKIRCLSDRSSVWPHLPLVALQNGSLRALRGVSETPPRVDDPEMALENGVEAAGLRTSKLRVEDIPLPPLSHVTDFAVARGGLGWLLLATDGSATVFALSGAVDAQVPGGIRWGPAWRALALTGQAQPSFAHVDALRLPDKRLEVMLRDAAGSLWITGWNGPEDDVWTFAGRVGETRGRSCAAAPRRRLGASISTTGDHASARCPPPRSTPSPLAPTTSSASVGAPSSRRSRTAWRRSSESRRTPRGRSCASS